ncbi:DNA replication kinase [Tubulinosema ratisbonensis]|uniref:DNA replication kinase n=1 Tax=Tubulinosema ratisbonensis TaxID=291195 RepID=A0A437AJS6_9MICR|nr:DNA replication kinase [Tubulinosema ratisbonensis]
MKKYIIFKNPYILIEDLRRKYKPFFKEYLKDKPTLNLNSYPLNCPFVPGTLKYNKNKTRQGVCEVCYEKFNDYFQHINTKEHRDFAVDDRNFHELDLFIASLNNNAGTFSNYSDVVYDDKCLTNLLPDVDGFINEYLNKK